MLSRQSQSIFTTPLALKCGKGPQEPSPAKGLERFFNGTLDEAMEREKGRVTLSPSEDSPLSNCLKSY